MPRPLILCYHAVSGSWPASLAVREERLAAQLARLRRAGFAGLTFSEAERRRRAGTLPPRTVVVTFDDGYRSTLRARPLLAEVGYPGTVFVVTGFVERGAPLAWEGTAHWACGPHAGELAGLRWSELAELAAAGWEVGSHTVSHPLLPALDDARLAHELAASRAAIAARLGACDALAYPYGRADARVAHAACRAGYLAACTLTASHRVDGPYLRPRVGVYDIDSGLRERAKLAPPLVALRRTALADAAAALRRVAAR